MNQAKNNKQKVFVYWGAVWCPPCNELKEQVFSHHRFPELVGHMLPIYLDGDSEQAQYWADKLQVSSYPTILLLNSDGRELTRISESLTFDEFEAAISSSKLDQLESFDSSVESALARQATASDWSILAYHNWNDELATKFDREELLNHRLTIAKIFPNNFPEGRALFLSQTLIALADDVASESKNSKFASNEHRALANQWLEYLMDDPKRAFVARRLLIYEVKNVATFVTRDNSKRLSALQKRWLAALTQISQNETLGLDDWLWTNYAQMQFHQLMNPSSRRYPKSINAKIKQAVAKVSQQAKTDFQRASVIPGAAYLLREIGEGHLARQLLTVELKKTKSPWYIYSALASLEERLGNKSAALDFVQKAHKSAIGRATKLQWVANDLLMTTRIGDDQEDARLIQLVSRFYKLAYGLSDGFSGRNFLRLEAVSDALTKYKNNAKIRDILLSYSERCSELPSQQIKRCTEYWAFL